MSTYNSFITSRPVSSAGAYSLQVTGLQPETAYRRFFLRILGTITRGASPTVLQPEEVSQLCDRVTYSPKGSKIDINVSGWNLDVLSRARYETRKNAIIGDAGTEVDHWIEIPLTPCVPNDRPARPAGQFLENSVIQVNMVTTLGEDDVTAFNGSIELWAQGDSASVGADPAVGGVVVQDVADFNGSNLTHRDGNLALMLLQRRDDFTNVQCRSNGEFVYQQATPLSLDLADYEHQQYQPNETARETAGDPMLVSVPNTAGSENFTRLFDVRNAKDVKGMINFTFNGRTASETYAYVYESFRS